MLDDPVPVDTPEDSVKVPPFWLVPEPALACSVVTSFVPLAPVADNVAAVSAVVSLLPDDPAG